MRRRLTGRTPKLLALGTIAASGLALTGCGDDPADNDVMFKTVDQCVQSGMNQAVCQTAYQDAMQAHLANAPKFDGQAACEAEYGTGQCISQPSPVATGTSGSGSGSFFIPFMAGYVMSSAINSLDDYDRYRRRQQQLGYAYGSSPIYINRSGQTMMPSYRTSSVGTTLRPADSVRPANVNTRTVSRMGFGGGSKSFSFGG